MKWSNRYSKQPRLPVPAAERPLRLGASLLIRLHCCFSLRSVAWGWDFADPCSASSGFTPSPGLSSELLRHGQRSFSGCPLSREGLKATLKVFFSFPSEESSLSLFYLLKADKCWLLGEPGTKTPLPWRCPPAFCVPHLPLTCGQHLASQAILLPEREECLRPCGWWRVLCLASPCSQESRGRPQMESHLQFSQSAGFWLL